MQAWKAIFVRMFRVKEIAAAYHCHRNTIRRRLKEVFAGDYRPLTRAKVMRFVEEYGPSDDIEFMKRLKI